MISAFDIFKIGIGPSSSHTVGPMNAGKSFIDLLVSSGELPRTTHIVVDLYGSLSLTGKGHATDVAIMMGLAGNSPQNVNIDSIAGFTQEVARTGRLPVAEGTHVVDFSPDENILFHTETLPRHENGMRITAWNGTERLLSKTYYSVGGGFIVEEEQFGQAHDVEAHVPYNFHSASELLKLCERNGLSVSGLMMQNELAMRSKEEIDAGFAAIWDVMHAGIERGMNTEGVLPGPLRVPRRASALRRMLVTTDKFSNDPMNVVDWVNMFALAVNEENAAGGRVVTAPTNGAAGVIPAVLHYYVNFLQGAGQPSEDGIANFLLTAGAIGIIYKENASLSGAEVGCQGEVGVACSMAAGALAAVMGGSPEQIENAAEIGMEHNLGMTCDPVGGLVQIPCIERNAMGAIKAINAARMALRGDGQHVVSLDKVIKTMMQTGADMKSKYKETSRGGLAVNVVEC